MRNITRLFALTATVLATVAWVYASFLSGGSDGESLVEAEGIGVAFLLTLPILISIAAVASAYSRRSGLIIGSLAVVMFCMVGIAILSVGIFFAPAALALVASAISAAIANVRGSDRGRNATPARARTTSANRD